MPKSKRPSLGPCGEHYVAAYLFGMGLSVELTKRGTKLVDMHVRTKNGKKQISLQVKAGGTGDNHVIKKRIPESSHYVWQVGTKAYGYSRKSHWYAFLTVGGWPLRKKASSPEIYFIPSRAVAKTLKDNPNDQRTWFWIYDHEIEKYRGHAGYKEFRKAFRSV